MKDPTCPAHHILLRAQGISGRGPSPLQLRRGLLQQSLLPSTQLAHLRPAQVAVLASGAIRAHALVNVLARPADPRPMPGRPHSRALASSVGGPGHAHLQAQPTSGLPSTGHLAAQHVAGHIAGQPARRLEASGRGGGRRRWGPGRGHGGAAFREGAARQAAAGRAVGRGLPVDLQLQARWGPEHAGAGHHRAKAPAASPEGSSIRVRRCTQTRCGENV
eukprot:CAMPEP_0176212910 /NCGR_PEP_ID=MMETSP0121_2-20121125/15390_1 /TAXON_ID=160619 /ORGANISM="Kryptoperidinium foliaceum, Strain CCMP 1326" /LENGTH=218 /DNA_ID=CAMNT_0017551963 /DNA_START=512 /DNA_END=1165 /DNA_ORIENTATION=+